LAQLTCNSAPNEQGVHVHVPAEQSTLAPIAHSLGYPCRCCSTVLAWQQVRTLVALTACLLSNGASLCFMLRASEPKCLTMSPSAVDVSLQAEELRKVALGAAGTHKPGEPIWYSDIGLHVEQLLESAIGKQAITGNLRDYQSPKPKTLSTAILPPLHGSLFCELLNSLVAVLTLLLSFSAHSIGGKCCVQNETWGPAR
jgi:hypothetical protein